MMKPVDYFCLLLFPLLLSGGQFFFKKTAESAVIHSFSRFIVSVLGSPYFWSALLIYGAATFLWLFILSRVPLSKAILFAALTFVIVPFIAAVFFGEQLRLAYWAGVFLIVVGIYVSVAAPFSG